MISGSSTLDIDTSRPHVGRIYDYVLGGHHNYGVDRDAAEAMVKIVPIYPKMARLNRWFIQLVGSRWAEEKVERVLDLASGLPTQGHLNDELPEARILFSDIDALNVTYGQQILTDKPNMRYVHADLRRPEALLDAAAKFFGEERRMAVSCIGIVYMLSDEEVRHLVQKLHAFCTPGSVLAMSFIAPLGKSSQAQEQANSVAPLAGVNLTMRTSDEMAALLSPWKVEDIKSIASWLDIEDMITAEELALNPMEMMGLVARY